MLFSAGTLMASPGNSYSDTAKVVSVKPLYETVQISQPEERCWDERVHHRGRSGKRSLTPTIAGAVIGGVIGNNVGKRGAQTPAAVAGALLGGAIGHDLSRKERSPGYVTTERRCEMVDHFEEQEELVGYRVKYRYKGNIFWTRTSEHPGKRIPVRVSVRPTHHDKWDRVRDRDRDYRRKTDFLDF
jgi:uncharacterized protein YcfJ